MAELAHQRNQLIAGFAQRIGHLRGYDGLAGATHHTVGRKLSELRSEDFFADPWHKVSQLRKAPRTESQVPHHQNLPFPAEHVDRTLHRTAMIVFHLRLRAYKIVRTSWEPSILIPFTEKRWPPDSNYAVAQPAVRLIQENEP